MRKKSTNGEEWKIYFLGVILSVIFMGILSLLLAILMTKYDVSDFLIQLLTCIVIGVSTFCGSLFSSKRIGAYGMKTGAILSVCLFMLFLVLGLITNGFIVSYAIVIKGLVLVISGFLGGVVGVNISSKRKF